MNQYQSSILWLGLILIALNIVVNLAEVKSAIFGSPGGDTGGTNSVPVPSNSQPSTNPALAPGTLPQPQATPPGQMV